MRRILIVITMAAVTVALFVGCGRKADDSPAVVRVPQQPSLHDKLVEQMIGNRLTEAFPKEMQLAPGPAPLADHGCKAAAQLKDESELADDGDAPTTR